ncbi:MAG: lysylphosphatidylglycerol synthase domain-containing protein [Patescibacteria group bacterium]|nr:lysylphosphatidylglycerol synthase domain-containing protein [Patescibacteria group bacterium]
MNRRLARSLLALVILLVTIGASIYFLSHHPTVGRQLLATPRPVLASLLLLYLFFMVSLWLVFRASLLICNAALPVSETMLVTAYSSIINFFGPLQSGPAFRALYLKKRHRVNLKQYAVASVAYYFFYAYFSGLCLVFGLAGWWTIVLGGLGLGGLFWLWHTPLLNITRFKSLSLRGLIFTAAATLLQVAVFTVIFYIELHTNNAAITFRQAIIYTGAANFALFVSLTPGAIGFRESFVLLAQRLHHIPNTTIVAASLLDRGVYIAMLLLLGVLIFGTHARRNLQRLTQ